MHACNIGENIKVPAELNVTKLAGLKLTECDGSIGSALPALSPFPESGEQEMHTPFREPTRLRRGQMRCAVTEDHKLRSPGRLPASREYLSHQQGDKCGRKKIGTQTLSRFCDSDASCLIDPVAFEKLSENHDFNHTAVSKNIHGNHYTQFFSKWPFYLSEGFNILLYGIGSKFFLLEEFRKHHLRDSGCIVVPGYDPSITAKHILNVIYHDRLQLPHHCGTLVDQLLVISEKMSLPSACESPLYIIIHNLDGLGLRNVGAQSIISRLASLPNIHVLASVDHLNISVLWSHDELARFCWIWEECTNFMNYTVEASYSNNLFLQHVLGGLANSGGSVGGGRGHASLISLRRVAASLTQNARDIFRIIAEHQLNAPLHQTSAATVGMPLEDLYWRCRDAFLTNNEATLRVQLTEFRDHELLKIRKGPDGTELFVIPMDNAYLRKFVDNFDGFC